MPVWNASHPCVVAKRIEDMCVHGASMHEACENGTVVQNSFVLTYPGKGNEPLVQTNVCRPQSLLHPPLYLIALPSVHIWNESESDADLCHACHDLCVRADMFEYLYDDVEYMHICIAGHVRPLISSCVVYCCFHSDVASNICLCGCSATQDSLCR